MLHLSDLVCVIIAMVAIMTYILYMVFFGTYMETPYPDGRCYMCRKGHAWPGQSCEKCGEIQP